MLRAHRVTECLTEYVRRVFERVIGGSEFLRGSCVKFSSSLINRHFVSIFSHTGRVCVLAKHSHTHRTRPQQPCPTAIQPNIGIAPEAPRWTLPVPFREQRHASYAEGRGLLIFLSRGCQLMDAMIAFSRWRRSSDFILKH